MQKTQTELKPGDIVIVRSPFLDLAEGDLGIVEDCYEYKGFYKIRLLLRSGREREFNKTGYFFMAALGGLERITNVEEFHVHP